MVPFVDLPSQNRSERRPTIRSIRSTAAPTAPILPMPRWAVPTVCSSMVTILPCARTSSGHPTGEPSLPSSRCANGDVKSLV